MRKKRLLGLTQCFTSSSRCYMLIIVFQCNCYLFLTFTLENLNFQLHSFSYISLLCPPSYRGTSLMMAQETLVKAHHHHHHLFSFLSIALFKKVFYFTTFTASIRFLKLLDAVIYFFYRFGLLALFIVSRILIKIHTFN